jgi:ribose-phosphate pyrophosphokinase
MSQEGSAAVFAPAATSAFGALVASALGTPLCEHEEREFDGGEHKIRSLETVRDRSVFVIQSLHGDGLGSANDRLCRLLFFIGSLKDAGARDVTACVSYLAYARQDRRTKARDPVTTRYVAQIFEAVGTDRIIGLDVHDLSAFENSFRIPTVHLVAAPVFVQHLAADAKGMEFVVVSPDIGGVKRARHFRESLEAALGREVELGFMDKNRSDDVVTGDAFVGDVAGKRVVLVDDLVSSGGTILRAVNACRRAGSTRIDAAVTHAAFCPEAHRLFAKEGPDSVLVTDSVALDGSFAPYLNRSLQVLSIAPLFAEAIRRLDQGGSVSELAGL